MNAKLIAAVVAIAILPLLVVAWLGVRSLRDERQLVEHRFDELVATRLADVDGTIGRVIERRETALRRALELPKRDSDSIRETVRDTPLVRQIFVLDVDGHLIHPQDQSPSENEKRFLERTREIWESKEPFYYPGDGASPSDHGWHVWYWGGGINLLLWQRDSKGGIVGAEVERMALTAEIIGELPSSGPEDPKLSDGRIVLEDASGKPIYGFGNFEPSKEASPRVTRPLTPPLAAWRLKYFEAPGSLDATSSGTESLTMGFGLGALVIAVLTLAIFVLRENRREAREAKRKVTFVNQVSHELKTPLTSIRMYAELLEDELDDDDSKAPEYLGVIVSESRRLSRLIGNVLSFAKKQKHRPSKSIVDEEIERVLDYHRPLFIDLGAELNFKGNSKETRLFDVDTLGQILGNLLSNAEKYGARSGGTVEITSDTQSDQTVVTVSDEGPGISRAVREKIFKPFYRISGKITEGVSGTGIGLSISRDLARLHGGDLTLETGTKGAKFKLVIKTPKPQGESL